MNSFGCDMSFFETLWFFLRNCLAIFTLLAGGYSLFFGWMFLYGKIEKKRRQMARAKREGAK